MKKSILFPGQGSQYAGMGLDFYNNYKVARDTYEELDDSLKINLSKIIFEDNKGDLNLTANTQPAIMATSVAIFRVLQEVKEFKVTDFNFCAGHSLGEYTALVCSESISFKDASVILRARGEAMQNAVRLGQGSMAAVLGAEPYELEKIIIESGLISVEISNDNCPGQVVISGKKNEVDIFCEIIKSKISKKTISLPVSAPFHCDLMRPASDVMKNLIMNMKMSSPKITVISNVDACETKKVEDIKIKLINQIYKKVRWRDTIDFMLRNNVNEFVEIGPGKTLSGMLKRFKKDIIIKNFSNTDNL